MTGIPVSVVLKKFNEQSESEEKHKFYDVPKPDDHLIIDELVSERDYVKSIEKEFADQVEGILDGLQLSHLRQKAKKEVDE